MWKELRTAGGLDVGFLLNSHQSNIQTSILISLSGNV